MNESKVVKAELSGFKSSLNETLHNTKQHFLLGRQHKSNNLIDFFLFYDKSMSALN